jgi:hypothetical protein
LGLTLAQAYLSDKYNNRERALTNYNFDSLHFISPFSASPAIYLYYRGSPKFARHSFITEAFESNNCSIYPCDIPWACSADHLPPNDGVRLRSYSHTERGPAIEPRATTVLYLYCRPSPITSNTASLAPVSQSPDDTDTHHPTSLLPDEFSSSRLRIAASFSSPAVAARPFAQWALSVAGPKMGPLCI